MGRRVGLALFSLGLLIWLASAPCYAAEYAADQVEEYVQQQFQEQLDASGAQDLFWLLDQDTRDLMGEYGLDEIGPEMVLELDAQQLFELLGKLVVSQLAQPLGVLGVLVGITVLGALVGGIKPAQDKPLSRLYETIAVVAAAVTATGTAAAVISQAAQTVQSTAYFMVSFIPVFAGILTVSGQAVSAGVYHMAVFALCQVISQTAVSVLIPLLGMYLAFSVISGFSSSLSFGKAAEMLKKTTVFLLTFSLTVFIGLLSVQGLVAGQVDQTVSKTAKFLISSFVPVVGSAVSDAFATVKTSLSLLKSCVGAFGILACVMICLPDLMVCLLYMGVFQIAGFAAEILQMGKLGKLYSAVLSVLTIVFSILLSVMMLIVIAAAIMLILGGQTQ